MGTSEEGPHAPGNGPAVFGRKPPAGEAGAESAIGTDPPGGGLGPAEQAGGPGLRRSRRAAQLSPAADGQGLAAGAMVQPLRPADGGSPGGPYLLPSLRGAGPAGGRAGPLDHQPVPHGVGGRGSRREAVPGTGPPVGAARAGAEGGDPDGRHRGGRPGAQTADVGGSGGPEAPSTPMRTGRIPIAGGDRTSATRCMWGWMRDRGSCARRC